jgi:hypothetical protein
MLLACAPPDRAENDERSGPSGATEACRPRANAGFCRVGCTGAPPVVTRRVSVDLKTVNRPYPGGVAVLELGINDGGRVVSACVLRSVRPDFDKAAQSAALRWQWKPFGLRGKPVGSVVAVSIPVPSQRIR